MSASEMKIIKDSVEQQIRKSSNVFLIGHKGPDFDSLGACIGLYELASSFGKKAYIVVDEENPLNPETKIEPGAKRLIEESKDKYRFVKPEEVEALKNDRSILFVVDTNKKKKVSLSDHLDWFRSVIILDHHTEDENTIESTHKFISEDISSASEMVARILFISKTKYTPTAANALLAGIRLDTRRFGSNTSGKTHDVAEKLLDNGADSEYVNTLFLEEFETFKRIGKLIINGTVIRKINDNTVSFTLNRHKPHSIYMKEDFAKIANRMMEFTGIDASFAMGYIDDKNVHISARSGKRVHVGNLMEEFQGGGTSTMAGTKIETDDLLGLEEELVKKVDEYTSRKESTPPEKPFEKVKKN